MNGSSFAASRLVLAFLFSPVILSLTITACSGGGSSATNNSPPPVTPTLSSITIAADHLSVAVGLTAQFKATGKYSDATTRDISASVTWTSATPGVAVINSSGLATSKAQGRSVITAISGSVTASETLTVTAAELVSMAVKGATMQLGSTAQMEAVGTYTNQSTQNLSGTAAWSSSNDYVASVDATGTVSAASAALSIVTATQNG